jgi:aspartyl protease family protein
MIGWAVRLVAIWGGAALVFYVVLGEWLTPPPEAPARVLTVSADAPSRNPRDQKISNSLVYRADRQGHVSLDAVVNGSSVKFLVDTGATYVALTLADAKAAGFGPGDLVFDAKAATANGLTRAARVTLREIRIGQFSMYEVPAFVEERLPISLLGQSFQTRLDGYEMRDGVLTLSWN